VLPPILKSSPNPGRAERGRRRGVRQPNGPEGATPEADSGLCRSLGVPLWRNDALAVDCPPRFRRKLESTAGKALRRIGDEIPTQRERILLDSRSQGNTNEEDKKGDSERSRAWARAGCISSRSASFGL
jgi:hypothetical protein